MGRKLNGFTVHQFRQLCSMEFEGIGGVNLLVGENSSGKTSILESLSLFARPLDPLELINTAKRREVKSSRERVLDGVRWLFPQSHADPDDSYFRGHIAFSGRGLSHKSVSIQFSGLLGDAVSEGLLAESDESPQATLPSEAFSSRRGASIAMCCETEQQSLFGGGDVHRFDFELWEDERYVSRAPVEGCQLPVATISPVSHRVELIQTRQLSEAVLAGEKYSVIEVVKLIDPRIENLEVISRTGISPTLWVRHRDAGFCPVSTLGDGTRRVLTMALQLHSVRGGLLLIDEIETAIHKDALARVFKWLVDACRTLDVQLFATTHSLEAIDALLLAELDHSAEIVAYQLPDQGQTEVKRFTGDILEGLRFERGLDIR